MICVLNPEIKSLSGKSGGVIFRTYKRPNGETETRAYLLRKKKNGAFGYERRTKPSDDELKRRHKFANATGAAAKMSDKQKDDYAKQWKKANYRFNGKKYNTLRGYIIARLYAENEA